MGRKRRKLESAFSETGNKKPFPCIECKNNLCGGFLYAHNSVRSFGRGSDLKDYIEERVLNTAVYIVENGVTVREAARKFGVSKSTVHKDITERLPRINNSLARQARKVLDLNKSERHIRGGMATKEKYLHIHSES